MIQSNAINSSLKNSGMMYAKANAARSAKNAFLVGILLLSVIIEFLFDYNEIFLVVQFALAACLFAVNYRLFGKFEKITALLGIVFVLLETVLYKDYGSSLTYFNSLLLIICFNNMALKKRQLSKIFILSALLMLILVLTSSRDGIVYVLITGIRFNPNTVGVILFASLVLGFSGISCLSLPNVVKRALYIALFALIIYLQLQTEARTTLVAEIAYVLIVLVRNKFKIFGHEKHFKALIIFGFVICLLIPVIYVALYNYMDGQSIVIFGKNLFTGRQNIWQDAFRMIAENPIFGVGNEEKYVEVYDSAHNSLLAIWKTSGGILLILYVITFIIAKPKLAKQHNINLFMRCAIIPVIFIAAFETILTDSNLYIFALIPLLNKIVESKKDYDE